MIAAGIPNVKLFNAGEAPLPVVTGDTPTADVVANELKQLLSGIAKYKNKQEISHAFVKLALGWIHQLNGCARNYLRLGASQISDRLFGHVDLICETLGLPATATG